MPEPKLWWTWDRGEPHLETCTVRVTGAHDGADQIELQIGLREVEVNPKTGEWKLNQGAALYPRHQCHPHALAGRV